MDFCRNNASLSSSTPPADYFQGFPAPAASSSSPSPSQLDDLFPSHTAEVDLSLEWLSVFVEDCLTSTGNCLPLPSITNNNNNAPTPPNPSLVVEEKKKQRQPLEEKENSPSTGLHKLFVVPGKARSKRKRVTSYKTTTGSGRRRTHHQNYDSTTLTSPWSQPFLHYSVDPPMLQQEYWLADSELIFPKSEGSTTTNNNSSSSSSRGNELNTGNQVIASLEEEEKDKEKKKKVVIWKKEGMEEGSNHDDDGGQEQQGQGRRCSHCLSQRTPQWRAGPLGPKTLCNACGVRYKSGRLLPEYRPAKSPTFVSFLHSNSHKKVLEMRSCGSASTTP